MKEINKMNKMYLIVNVYNKKTHDAFSFKFKYEESWKVIEENINNKMTSLNWDKKDCYIFQRFDKKDKVKIIKE